MTGDWKTNGGCRTPDAEPNPLAVEWISDTALATNMLDNLIPSPSGDIITGPTSLPADLGNGAAFVRNHAPITNQPYEVVAQFRCGNTKPTLDITMAKIAKGRDAIKDLTQLMRIAQKRYGALRNCTPQQP